MEIKELVEKIVRAIVDSPEEVVVSEIRGSHAGIVEIQVSKRDMGHVIGKNGKNIKALRTIVSASGKGKRYMVELVEQNRYHRSNRHHQHGQDRDTDRVGKS